VSSRSIKMKTATAAPAGSLAAYRKRASEEATKKFEKLQERERQNEHHPWLDNGFPCFGCPYNENDECIDLHYSTSCKYIEKWVLRSYGHSHGNNSNSNNSK
jgi:hypothetical protein